MKYSLLSLFIVVTVVCVLCAFMPGWLAAILFLVLAGASALLLISLVIACAFLAVIVPIEFIVHLLSRRREEP